jgi:hypothetical protein|tara:strand:- start:343 stop:810 length:468 start_codon:yes stop_codon:yes gene_type:complete
MSEEATLNLQVGSFDEGVKSAGGDRTPLETGRYKLRIKSWKLKETGPAAKVPGQQMIQWTFDVLEGPEGKSAEEQESYIGQPCWNNTMVQGEGIGFFWAFIAALEKDGVNVRFEGESITTQWLNSLVGLVVQADVTLGTYQGRPSENFDRFLKDE